MRFAKPLKKAFPCSMFVIATSSSKDAPAQKARSPSDLRIITDTLVSLDYCFIVSLSRCKRTDTKELLAGWPNSTVAILLFILV